MLGVATNAISEWESGQESLTVLHLVGWAGTLRLRITIVDAFDRLIHCPLPRDPGESWNSHELRRLTAALRNVRKAGAGMSQLEVARRAGISRTSLRHWEDMTTCPRTLSLIRWSMA